MCVYGLCAACIVRGSALNTGMEGLVGVEVAAVHVHGGVGADMGGGWMHERFYQHLCWVMTWSVPLPFPFDGDGETVGRRT
jgi:hypothetical protein